LIHRSTDDAILITLHTALSHLDKRNTYVRMLFIDYSSEFNTIVLTKLITKLRLLGLSTSLCNWVLDLLTCQILDLEYKKLHVLSSIEIPNSMGKIKSEIYNVEITNFRSLFKP
jgi:hypothetical protein